MLTTNFKNILTSLIYGKKVTGGSYTYLPCFLTTMSGSSYNYYNAYPYNYIYEIASLGFNSIYKTTPGSSTYPGLYFGIGNGEAQTADAYKLSNQITSYSLSSLEVTRDTETNSVYVIANGNVNTDIKITEAAIFMGTSNLYSNPSGSSGTSGLIMLTIDHFDALDLKKGDSFTITVKISI